MLSCLLYGHGHPHHYSPPIIICLFLRLVINKLQGLRINTGISKQYQHSPPSHRFARLRFGGSRRGFTTDIHTNVCRHQKLCVYGLGEHFRRISTNTHWCVFVDIVNVLRRRRHLCLDMNAVSVYIATCRYIVQANQYDQDSLADLNRYLPYLRQAISCCVCGELQGHKPLFYSFPIALVAMLTFCVIVCKSDHQHFKNCAVYIVPIQRTDLTVTITFFMSCPGHGSASGHDKLIQLSLTL